MLLVYGHRMVGVLQMGTKCSALREAFLEQKIPIDAVSIRDVTPLCKATGPRERPRKRLYMLDCLLAGLEDW